jgi:hypothetical protein
MASKGGQVHSCCVSFYTWTQLIQVYVCTVAAVILWKDVVKVRLRAPFQNTVFL